MRWQADTPSRLGIIISISTKSYFDPAFILLTASNPSSFGLVSKSVEGRNLRTYCTVDRAMECIQKLATNTSASRIIFNQQDLRWSNTSWVHLCALFAGFIGRKSLLCLLH